MDVGPSNKAIEPYEKAIREFLKQWGLHHPWEKEMEKAVSRLKELVGWKT